MEAFLGDIRNTLNGAPAYLRHHQRQEVAPTGSVPVTRLSFEKTRTSLLQHPFVTRGGIAVDKIYRVLLAILSTNDQSAKAPSRPKAPVEMTCFDPMHHAVGCERCEATGMFERKHGFGGYTCVQCGHANYTDLHFGDPTWPGGESERIHWEVAQPETNYTEHTSSIERIGALINASRDVQVRALTVLCSYRTRHHISSIDVVASAALIIATNPLLRDTHIVEVPPAPPAPFACQTCDHRWSRMVDARMCCRNGNNYTASKVRRIHFEMQGPPPQGEFGLRGCGDSQQGM